MNVRVGFIYLIFLFLCGNAAAGSQSLNITVDGISYVASLHESNFTKEITVNSNALKSEDTKNLEVYQGSIESVPGSWVAASRQDGTWQGLVSIYDKLYDFKGVSLSDRALIVNNEYSSHSMQATEIDFSSDVLDMTKFCAIKHPELEEKSALASVLPNAATIDSTSQNPVAFAVGGVTQAVNIILALDQFHTAQYGNDSVPRAIRILNNVDAIYRNSLGIALNNTAIVSYDNANPIFGNETDANVLLEQLRQTQANVFGNNQRTLGSVLTFRDLQVGGNNGVAGIAYTRGTCSNFSLSFNEDRTVSNESVSSIILAHEMGHNFGASHDGPNPNPANAACPPGLNIMSPVVGNGLTAFSNCSRTEINAHIARGTCYKDPIDIALSRFGAAPPNNLTQQQTITRQIAVTNNGTVSVNNIVIDGDIDNVAFARFSEVTVNGQACSINNAGQTYRCTIASLAANNQQVVSENIQAISLGSFTVSSGFDSSDVSQRIDIFPGNQSISDNRTVSQAAAAPNAPSSLNASAQTTGDIALTWDDNSNNEQNFIVQRSSNSGSFTTIANLPANRVSYNDNNANLQIGTAYTYRVSAMNSLGQNFSNTSTATALEPTVVSNNSPTNNNDSADNSSGGGGGGGGALYLLTVLVVLTRICKLKYKINLFK